MKNKTLAVGNTFTFTHQCDTFKKRNPFAKFAAGYNSPKKRKISNETTRDVIDLSASDDEELNIPELRNIKNPIPSPSPKSNPSDSYIYDQVDMDSKQPAAKEGIDLVSSSTSSTKQSSHPNDKDNDSDESSVNEGNNDIEMNTLEILKATPLATTREEFENKYPSCIYQTPASSVPIPTPNPSDIIFGNSHVHRHPGTF
jgi:hypothetical protein